MIKKVPLNSGLEIDFNDESNRYFGDYYRICVVATFRCDLRSLPDADDEEVAFRSQAIKSLGEQFTIVKRLQRMGVASADVDRTRKALIDDFLSHTRKYLCRPGYLRALITAEMKKCVSTRRFYG